MTTHSPAEWAEAFLFGTGVFAAASVVYFLLVDADASDFDPRPLVRRVVESGRVDPLLIAVPAVKADVKAAVRDAAVTVAALFMLLSPAAAPEATR